MLQILEPKALLFLNGKILVGMLNDFFPVLTYLEAHKKKFMRRVES